MKKTFKIAVVLVVSILFVFTASCELLLGILFSVNGKVVNVKADVGASQVTSKDGTTSLSGVEVTFTNIKDANKSKKATVGSDGSYSITEIAQGTYRITASKTGWTFIPVEEFNNNGLITDVPDILAFPTADAGNLTVIMQWKDRTRDIDLHMTYGAEEAGNNARHVFYSTKTADITGGTATLDRDVKNTDLTSNAKLVPTETITVTATSTIATQDLRFYVRDFTQASGLTGDIPNSISPAGVKMHVFQGTTHLGTWGVPFNTAERTLRVVRVAFGTGNNFTVYTDTQSATDNVYRNIGTIGIPVDAIR